jgi:hypothetical protein
MEAERVKKLTEKCRALPTVQSIDGLWRLCQAYYPANRSKAKHKYSPVPYFATEADAAAKAEWWRATVEHKLARGGAAAVAAKRALDALGIDAIVSAAAGHLADDDDDDDDVPSSGIFNENVSPPAERVTRGRLAGGGGGDGGGGGGDGGGRVDGEPGAAHHRLRHQQGGVLAGLATRPLFSST